MSVQSSTGGPKPSRKRGVVPQKSSVNNIPDLALVGIVLVIGVLAIVLIFMGVKAMVTPLLENLEKEEKKTTSSVLGDTADLEDMEFIEAFSRKDLVPHLPTPPPLPVDPKSVDGKEITTYESFLVIGESGYNYYKYNQNAVDNFVNNLNSSINKLPDDVEVYNMIIPSSIDIMLPLGVLEQYDTLTSDQGKTIKYLNSVISERAIDIDIYPMLKAYCDKDLYLNTQDNWSSLGAYYASSAWKYANGFSVPSLATYDKRTVEGFMGYIGNFIGFENPEKIQYFKPNADLSIAEFNVNEADKDTSSSSSPVFPDVTNVDANLKTNVFLGGTRAITQIVNHSNTEDTSIVIVGDENAYQLAPYIAEDFTKTYLVDYREYTGNLKTLVESTNAKKVLYCPSINATISSEKSGLID